MRNEPLRDASQRIRSGEDQFLRIATPALLLVAALLFLRPSSPVGRLIVQWYDRYSSEREVARRWPELVQASFRLYEGETEPEILIFSDFECPFCIANVPSIDSAVAAGVRIGYVHSPAERNLRSREAAVVAVCASQRGQFKVAYDFYIRGTEWRSTRDSVLVPPSIDTKDLRTCIADSGATRLVDESIALAAAAGISGTPTFATKHRVQVGMQSVAKLTALAREPK